MYSSLAEMSGKRSKRNVGRIFKGKKKMTVTEITVPLSDHIDKATNTDQSESCKVDKATDTSDDTTRVCNDSECDQTTDSIPNLESFLRIAKSMLSPIWFIDGSSSDVLRFFQICQTRLSSTTSEPIAIAKSLHITETGWNAFVYGIKVPSTCPLIQNIPQILSLTSFTEVISVFQSCFECSGNTDDRFVQMCQLRKGQFLSVKKTIVAFLHSNSEGHATVRHVSCEILVNSEGVSCSVCKDYRNRLRAMHSSFIKSNSKATCVNIRYLSTPKRKVRVNSLRSKVKNSRNALNRVKRQLKELTRASGVEVDEQLKTDIMTVIDKHQEINGIKPDAFQRVFLGATGVNT
jgi:hypothetical protein